MRDLNLKPVRSVEEIRDGLLSLPSNANRQDELSLLIDWLIARERHMNRSGIAALRAFEEKMGDESSPALRSLTLLDEHMGGNRLYKTALSPTDQFIKAVHMADAAVQIRFDMERLENEKRFPITSFIPTKNAIRFEGLQNVFDKQAEASLQSAEDFIERHSAISTQKRNPAPKLS